MPLHVMLACRDPIQVEHFIKDMITFEIQQQAVIHLTSKMTHKLTCHLFFRKQVGVATLGGYLYAIGGCDHGHRYDTVERYDPGKDEWVSVAPMSTPRSGCGVGVLDGFIYVVGGYDGTSYLSSVER